VRAGLSKQRIESLQTFNTSLQGGAVTFGEGTVVKHSTRAGTELSEALHLYATASVCQLCRAGYAVALAICLRWRPASPTSPAIWMSTGFSEGSFPLLQIDGLIVAARIEFRAPYFVHSLMLGSTVVNRRPQSQIQVPQPL
jgi:hypothetical protein